MSFKFIKTALSYFLCAVIGIVAYIVLTSDTAKAEYYGARWKTNSVCIQNQIDDPMIRQAMVNSIVRIRNNTNVKIVNFGSSDCAASGYKNIIYAQDSKYGLQHNWVGRMVPKTMTWGQTTNGKWTWLFSKNYLQFNISYRTSTAYNKLIDWERVTAHELLHALGEDHTHETCSSIVSHKPGCTNRIMYPTSYDYSEIKKFYSW